ncbi:MAG TPA: ankyrin repeat domain-containing protein, partial [Gemmatimonadaceae bacterium]
MNPALNALLEAASQADSSRVAELLDADPSLVNQRGTLRGHTGLRTALHFAIASALANEETVKTLLEHAADPNVRDEGDNAYPLHFAAELLELPVIRLLIEHGADPVGTGDVHELDVIGWAAVFEPVHLAIEGEARAARRREVVDYLLAHGAKHTIASAVAMGDIDDIRRIAVIDRASLDRELDATNQRRRPLHLAIVKKQLASLNALLELGANTELTDAAGLTPLDQAALNYQNEFTDALLTHGAILRLPAAIVLDRDVDRLLRENAAELAPGNRWGTLIIRAAEHSPGRTIERLIAHGASANAADDETTSVDGATGYSALHAAAFNGNTEAVSMLLEHGASVTARDSRYHGTPAGWADYAKHIQIREAILRGPIDMFDAVAFNRVDRLRETFDRDPAALNRPMRTSLLREPGPDEWTKAWWTPLAMAVVLGNAAAARELVQLGARIDEVSPDGESLRDLASQGGNTGIVRLFDEFGGATSDAPAAEPDRTALVARFLANACPDHHVRGGESHEVALHLAEQLLNKHPDIAHENIYTAVVCGDRD